MLVIFNFFLGFLLSLATSGSDWWVDRKKTDDSFHKSNFFSPTMGIPAI